MQHSIMLGEPDNNGYKVRYRTLCELLQKRSNSMFVSMSRISKETGLVDERLWNLCRRVRGASDTKYLDTWVQRFRERGYRQEIIRLLTETTHRELRAAYKRLGFPYVYNGSDAPVSHTSITPERISLERQLILHGTNQTEIARQLGYSRARAWQRIQELRLYDAWKRARQ